MAGRRAGHTPPVLEETARPRFAGLTGAFRVVALVEAVTYLLLLAATVIYRLLDGPDLVSALGPVHGVAFLAYLALVLQIRDDQRWNLWTTVLVVVAAALPGGGFWAERKVA